MSAPRPWFLDGLGAGAPQWLKDAATTARAYAAAVVDEFRRGLGHDIDEIIEPDSPADAVQAAGTPRAEDADSHPGAGAGHLTGRATSELLHDGATAIEWWLSARGVPTGTRPYWKASAADLRDRAHQFEAIDE